MKFSPLTRAFYRRDTHEVARDLLGKLLVREGNELVLTGRITEVESYVGQNDAACHASKGRTERTAIMFGDAGYAYVYLIYGIYNCLNIVSDKEDFPAAILIRALEPIEGIDTMAVRRNRKAPQYPLSPAQKWHLTTGPGKLCQALDIDRTLNGADVTAGEALYLADDGFAVSPADIAATERIGVDYAGEDAKLPWRYILKDSAFLSR